MSRAALQLLKLASQQTFWQGQRRAVSALLQNANLQMTSQLPTQQTRTLSTVQGRPGRGGPTSQDYRWWVVMLVPVMYFAWWMRQPERKEGAPSLFGSQVSQGFRRQIEVFTQQHGYALPTSDEIEQLSWLEVQDISTPENRSGQPDVDLHFEVKRALARVQFWTLLLQGDYALYSQSFPSGLSEADFMSESQKARQMSQDQQAAVRASCFLFTSVKGQAMLKEKGYKVPEDSEMFLTALGTPGRDTGFPVVDALTPAQRMQLKYAYWSETHLRQMLFSEGGVRMFQDLRQAQEQLNPQEFQDLLSVWRMRWLTNLAGFRLDKTGVGCYLESTVYHRVQMLLEVLDILLEKNLSVEEVFQSYLQRRAQAATCVQASEPSALSNLLGHLCALGDVDDPERGRQLRQGYEVWKCLGGIQSDLVGQYDRFWRDPNNKTPTYTPALFNSVVACLENNQELADIARVHFKQDYSPVAVAAAFSSALLSSLCCNDMTQKIVSCRDLALINNLPASLATWFDSGCMDGFDIENGALVMREDLEAVSPSPR